MGPGAEARSQRDLGAYGGEGGFVGQVDSVHPPRARTVGAQEARSLVGPNQQRTSADPLSSITSLEHGRTQAWGQAKLWGPLGDPSRAGTDLGKRSGKSREGAGWGLHTSDPGHQMPSAGSSTRRGFAANPGGRTLISPQKASPHISIAQHFRRSKKSLW